MLGLTDSDCKMKYGRKHSLRFFDVSHHLFRTHTQMTQDGNTPTFVVYVVVEGLLPLIVYSKQKY